MSKTFDKVLGHNLKDIRTKCDYSQQYVAERLGVTRHCIGNYENGLRSIDMETLYKLCDIYNANINDVIANLRKYVYKK